MGEGEGVLASGLRGMLCTLFRLFDLIHCRLLLRPCKEIGLLELNELAGELGPLDRGDELADENDCESGSILRRGERGDLIRIKPCSERLLARDGLPGPWAMFSTLRLLSVCNERN